LCAGDDFGVVAAVPRGQVGAAVEYQGSKAGRVQLPKQRDSRTHSIEVGGAKVYLTVSVLPDGGVCEVSMKMSKQGSTLAGMMDALSEMMSAALQWGAPLEYLVEKLVHMRFEPAGMTNDRDFRTATSVLDAAARRLAMDHLDAATRQALGIYTSAERAELEARGPAGSELDREWLDLTGIAMSAPVTV
jgi:ribonucleoside-diphosphate reductase alpha chain